MEEELRHIIEQYRFREEGNSLWTDTFDTFCAKHSLDKDRFCYLFAKVVAEEFVNGEMSFADGDLAMNQLAKVMGVDLKGFPLEIYLAFDSGEFYREDDPKGTIPWQKYTLPIVMEVLVAEGLL